MGDVLHCCRVQITALENKYCQLLCPKTYTIDDVKKFVEKIKNEYNVNWWALVALPCACFPLRSHVATVAACRILDNLPAAATGITTDGSVLYSHGFPVGGRELDTGAYFLYNHVRMRILYHTSPEYVGVRIVGFEVHPMR